MKRRVIGLSLLGVAAYLVFALALLPARFVFAQFAGLLPSEISLHGIQGTIWRGSALVSWHDITAGPVHWDMQALALFTGHLEAAIQAKLPQGFANFTMRLASGGDLELSDVQLAMPLATAARLAGQPAELLHGDLTLQLDTLRIEQQKPVAASGRGMLGNLYSSLSGDTALGSYQGEIKTTDAGIIVTAADQSGPLRLQAQATLNPQGKWQATGTIGVRDAGNSRLAGMLQFLGPADASGMRRFRFSGQLNY